MSRHTLGTEADQFTVKVGVRTPLDAYRSPDALAAHRESYVTALREFNARGLPARTWTLQFLLRRSACHLLDHAWEMEDKDLSGVA